VSVITLGVLGECHIQVGDRSVTPSAPHLFALLLYLGTSAGRQVPRSVIQDLLFPDQPSSAAAHNLRQLLYRLRRMELSVVTNASTVQIRREAVVDKVAHFLSATYRESREAETATCTLLPAYRPPTAPFSSWVETYRDGVHRALIRKLGSDLQTARRSADWPAVESFACRLLSIDNFNETATLCLAEALARTGSKHRAVTLLGDFEQEVGSSLRSLALPSQLLKRRISESPTVQPFDGTETPFVGRTHEMSSLNGLWAEALSGRAKAVVVTGEQLIGKSRLVSEFLSIVRLDGSGRVLLSRRLPADRSRPLSLFADISKHLLGMPGAAGCSPSTLSFLTRLSKAPDGVDAPYVDQSEIEFSVGGVRRAVLDLIDSVSSERPLVIAIDDVQHLDEGSRLLLQELPLQLATSPVLLILAGATDSTSWTRARHLRLEPIEWPALRSAAERLASREHAENASTVDWCLTTAAGNPGYLELLLQSSVTAPDRCLPPDLVALVDERVRVLAPTSRRLLQAIAVYGAPCDGGVIEQLCGLGKADILPCLEELEESSMVVSSQEDIRCRSALIHQRVLAGASGSVLRVLHARAARHLARRNDAGVPSQEVAWRIAAHWSFAGDTANARHWQRACWRQSVAIGQPMVAAAGIRQQLSASVGQDDRAMLLDELAHALFAAREVSALQEVLRERTCLSSHVGDTMAERERLEFDTIEAGLLNHDDPDQYRGRLRTLLRSQQLDVRRRISGARSLMIAADQDLDRALALETCVVNSTIDPPDTRSALLHCQTTLIYHATFGDREEALRNIHKLTSLVASADPSWEATSARLNIALGRLIVDSEPIDISDLESAFDECRAAEMNRMALSIAGRIGSYYVDIGDIERAASWIANAESLLLRPGSDRVSPDFLTSRADLALLTGDFSRARELISLMPRYSPRFMTGIFRNSLLLYRLRCEQMEFGSPASAREIAQLTEWHSEARSLGRHDEHMEVLWVALASVGRGQEASSHLYEYLTESRRERRQCSYLLRTRTATDNVWRAVQRISTGGYRAT
jgi:DNA-binding SARP family transcriptional activator